MNLISALSSARARWSTRWTQLIVVLILLASTFWVHLSEFSAQPEWDSHIFLVIAKQLRYGLLPYRDLWELKPPGVFYYLAGIFAVLPEALWSVRCVDFALYLVGGFAFYQLCRREVSRPLAVVGTAGWLFVAHHETFNLGGFYTEEYAAIGGVIAVACAATYGASGRLRWALASGLAVAAAALFKHPGAAALVPAAVLITRRPALRAYALLLLGVTLPVLLVVAYFWSQGALEQFLECNVWAVLVHGRIHQQVDQALLIQRLRDLVTQGEEHLTPFPFLLAALAVGVPFALLRPSWLRLATLLWVALDFLGVAAQRQYAQHHFILTFPSTCLLGTLAAGWLLQPRAQERWFVTLPRVALCLGVLWFALPALRHTWQIRLPEVRANWRLLLSGPGAWQQSPARTNFEEGVGRYLRERTQPGDRIHVQGYTGTLLGIYWAADRQVASRYFYDPPYPIDQTHALAELEQNRPAYIVVAARPPFLYVMPWLMANYTLESVKWLDYGSDIWVRNEPAPFSAGSINGLTQSPYVRALTLPTVPASAHAPAVGPPALRRGYWTSPVLPVRSDDGKVFIDWNPRADLVWNRTERGLASAEASLGGPDNDVRTVIGVPTKRGYWTGWPRPDPQVVTVRLGFPAMIDQVDLIPNDYRLRPKHGCEAALVETTNHAGDPAAKDFELAAGTWEELRYGIRRFHFPARRASALRVRVTPGSCGVEGGIHRIRAASSGMGISVRYRTGASPVLDGEPWRALDDNDDLLWVPGRRYIQVQYELWSTYPDASPVLQSAQVGRVRYEIEPPPH